MFLTRVVSELYISYAHWERTYWRTLEKPVATSGYPFSIPWFNTPYIADKVNGQTDGRTDSGKFNSPLLILWGRGQKKKRYSRTFVKNHLSIAVRDQHWCTTYHMSTGGRAIIWIKIAGTPQTREEAKCTMACRYPCEMGHLRPMGNYR